MDWSTNDYDGLTNELFFHYLEFELCEFCNDFILIVKTFILVKFQMIYTPTNIRLFFKKKESLKKFNLDS